MITSLTSFKVAINDKYDNPHSIKVTSNNIKGAMLTAVAYLLSINTPGPFKLIGIEINFGE